MNIANESSRAQQTRSSIVELVVHFPNRVFSTEEEFKASLEEPYVLLANALNHRLNANVVNVRFVDNTTMVIEVLELSALKIALKSIGVKIVKVFNLVFAKVDGNWLPVINHYITQRSYNYLKLIPKASVLDVMAISISYKRQFGRLPFSLQVVESSSRNHPHL